MTKKFKFDLKQKVKLVGSEETGIIIGRAEYVADTSSYWVRYMAGDGRMTCSWHSAEFLKAVPVTKVKKKRLTPGRI